MPIGSIFPFANQSHGNLASPTIVVLNSELVSATASGTGRNAALNFGGPLHHPMEPATFHPSCPSKDANKRCRYTSAPEKCSSPFFVLNTRKEEYATISSLALSRPSSS